MGVSCGSSMRGISWKDIAQISESAFAIFLLADDNRRQTLPATFNGADMPRTTGEFAGKLPASFASVAKVRSHTSRAPMRKTSALKSQTPDFVQLDLFLDSRAVVLANDAIHALLARDAARATVALERLRMEEPRHHLLGALEGLRRTLEAWPSPFTTAADIERAIHWLETDVHSMARAALGENAGNFVLPFWRDLAQAPGAHVYDAALPHAYCAALYLRCGDPEAAAAAAQAVERADTNADALHWLAVARYRMEGLDACRIPLMRLALLEPQRLPATFQEIDDPLLNRDWYAFQAACHWLDPEGEEFGSWFPAWYLVEHPGAVVDFGSPLTLPETVPVQAMKRLARLVKLEKGGYSPALISARSRLRELDSNMFEFYMARRNVSHR